MDFDEVHYKLLDATCEISGSRHANPASVIFYGKIYPANIIAARAWLDVLETMKEQDKDTVVSLDYTTFIVYNKSMDIQEIKNLLENALSKIPGASRHSFYLFDADDDEETEIKLKVKGAKNAKGV